MSRHSRAVQNHSLPSLKPSCVATWHLALHCGNPASGNKLFISMSQVMSLVPRQHAHLEGLTRRHYITDGGLVLPPAIILLFLCFSCTCVSPTCTVSIVARARLETSKLYAKNNAYILGRLRQLRVHCPAGRRGGAILELVLESKQVSAWDVGLVDWGLYLQSRGYSTTFSTIQTLVCNPAGML